MASSSSSSSFASSSSSSSLLELVATILLGFLFTSSICNHISPGLNVEGNASKTPEDVELTTNSVDVVIGHSVGRAYYVDPIQFLDPDDSSTCVSFSSIFTFKLVQFNNSSYRPGDGMAFMIVSDPQLPLNSAGAYLGLTNSSLDGDSRNHFLAVEFDTSQDSSAGDPARDHIGVNINGIQSVDIFKLEGDLTNLLRSNSTLTAWVEYESSQQLLEIRVSTLSQRPRLPLLKYQVGLAGIIQEKMYVGFYKQQRDQQQHGSKFRLPAQEQIDIHWFAFPRCGSAALLVLEAAERSYKKLQQERNDRKRWLRESLQRNASERRYSGCGETAVGGFAAEREAIPGRIISDRKVVYEFMPNGSLDKHLFSPDVTLLWQQRFHILKGVGEALTFLHDGWEQRVIHRDVKAANVLLDSKFTARLGDFGLARLMEHSRGPQTMTKAGTTGYIAPELAYTGRATEKSDVYSFGILALELVSGRRALDLDFEFDEEGILLLDWIWQMQERGRLMEVVDAKLQDDFDVEQVTLVLYMALQCCHPDANDRPTMRKCCQMLTGDAAPLTPHASRPMTLYYYPDTPVIPSSCSTSEYPFSSSQQQPLVERASDDKSKALYTGGVVFLDPLFFVREEG